MTFGFAFLTFVLPICIQDAAEKIVAPSAKTISRDLKEDGVRDAYLLAHMAMVDDRPLYVEGALIAEKLAGEKWRLNSVYRHPKDKDVDRERWQLSVVFDADQSPTKDFDHKPTEAEVDAFLKHAWWKFDAENNFRLVHGKVYAETWEKALGYKPKHKYPKP